MGERTHTKKQLPKFVEGELRKQIGKREDNVSGNLDHNWSILNARELSPTTLAYLTLIGFRIKRKYLLFELSIVIVSDEEGKILSIIQ